MQTDLVSISEAARMLAAHGDEVERSSLSRYVKGHAGALNPTRLGRQTMVSFSALMAHRRENINLEAPLGAPPPAAAGNHAGHDAKTRTAAAVATMKEIELERMLGSVTPVSEVLQAAEDAVAMLAAEEARLVQLQAERMANALGIEARVIRPHLKNMVHRLRSGFARALTRRLAAMSGGADDEHESTCQ